VLKTKVENTEGRPPITTRAPSAEKEESCKMLAMNGLNSSTPSSDVKYPPNVANQRGLSQTDLEVDKLYEPKQNKKIVRIFTVILYMFSVSLGAILLSLYYVFLWKNPHTQAALQKAKGLNTSTSPVLLETTVPPDFGDLQPREEGQISELRLLETGATAFPKRTRGVPPVASLLDSRLNVNLNDDGLSRHPLEMREVLGEEQDESEWH